MTESTHRFERTSFLKRSFAYGALAASCLNLVGCSDVNGSSMDGHRLPQDRRYLVVSSAHFTHQDGKFVAENNSLPEPLSSDVQHALSDPFVEFAANEGYLSSASVNVVAYNDNPLYADPYTSPENGAQTNDRFDLIIDAGMLPPDRKLFKNALSLRLAAVHEATHSFNNEWWIAINEGRLFNDEQKLERILHLNSACTSVARWLKNDSRGLVPSYSIGTNCTPALWSNVSNSELEKKFRCIDEGYVQQDLENSKEMNVAGHPYDNASELASSVTTSLYLNPSYIKRCFANQDAKEVAIITEYIRATLEVSFAFNPKLETFLRQNKETADALDYLMGSE